MFISVAIATFNGERFIEEQLNSILKQTRLPDEIIICDDCSSDSTVEIIKRIELTTNIYIKIIENQINLGYTNNFLKAISLTKGDLIFISDQDDVWFDNKIAKVCDLANKYSNKHVFINDTYFVDEHLNKTGLTKLQTIKKIYNNDSQFVAGCCTAITGDLLKIFSLMPNDYSYDEWIHYLGSITNTRVVIDEPLQLYRRHGGNTSNVVYNNLGKLSYISPLVSRLMRIFYFNRNKKVKYLNRQLAATLIIKNIFKENDLNGYFDDTLQINRYLDSMIQNLNIKLRFYNNYFIKILFFNLPSS